MINPITNTTNNFFTANNSVESSASSVSAHDFKAELTAILDEKRATVKETLEEMKEQRELLDAVKSERETDETLTRIMPDGSIMITKIEGGEVVSTDKFQPHMQVVIDDNKPIPTDVNGLPVISRAETKLEPVSSVFGLIFPKNQG